MLSGQAETEARKGSGVGMVDLRAKDKSGLYGAEAYTAAVAIQ